MKKGVEIPLQLILFVFVFGVLTLFINSMNLLPYPIYFMGAEAIVERGHFYLDGSHTPGFYTTVAAWADQFIYKDHIYSNKQPGTFFINSIPYFFLYKIGISFQRDKILTCGLITLFTSTLIVSLMVIFFFNIIFKVTSSIAFALLITFLFAFGTLIFPYSSYTHHDVCATFFLFLGFYLLFYRYNQSCTKPLINISLAGFCIGFALFCSYNSIPITVALLFYVILYKNNKDIVLFLIFLFIGFLPTFIFNHYFFGSPTMFSSMLAYNLSTGYSVSSPNSIRNVPNNLAFYLTSMNTSILSFSPIMVIGALGIFLLPPRYRNEKTALLLAVFFHFVFLLPLGFVGWCQYGPRYLLELTPFTLIGVSGIFTRIQVSTFFSGFEKFFIFVAVLAVGIASIIICGAGSICGTMYCGYYEHAFLNCCHWLRNGNMPQFYFYKFGLIIIFLSFVLFYLRIRLRTKKKINVEEVL